jgi:hypothetical protein
MEKNERREEVYVGLEGRTVDKDAKPKGGRLTRKGNSQVCRSDS